MISAPPTAVRGNFSGSGAHYFAVTRITAIAFVASLGAHVTLAAMLLAPHVSSDVSPFDPPPQLAGETFELPAPPLSDVPLSNAASSPDSVAASAPEDEGDAPARPSPPTRGKPAARPSHAGRPSAGRADQDGEGASAANGAAGLYGAVGDRSAADLATAFTRGFPQAASADPLWKAAPFGSAGSATVIVTLDSEGRVEQTDVTGAPSPALASALRRTIALVRGRPFTARGRVTKIDVTATVSAKDVDDGLHGDVFALGSGLDGSAFFALAIGRRIDAHFRVR